MSHKQNEAEVYFTELCTKPGFAQMRVFGLIQKAKEEASKKEAIQDILFPKEETLKGKRREFVEEICPINEHESLVVTSQRYNNGEQLMFTTHLFNTSQIQLLCKNHEYYEDRETAILAGLLKKMGGNDSIIEATVLMLRGMNKTKD